MTESPVVVMESPVVGTQSPVVLGLDFGGTKIAVAVCDLVGNRVGDTVVATRASAGAASAFDRAIATARELLLTAARDRELVAVAAATFGIPFDDRVELAPAIPGWETFAFGRELRAAFPGVRLAMATDVKAAALAELRWGALVGCDPAIYLNLGTGLASAIVAGGAVISGAHGAAGEIGYNVREPADVGKSPAERITLEDVVSGKALAAIADTEFGAQTSVAEIFDRANDRACGRTHRRGLHSRTGPARRQLGDRGGSGAHRGRRRPRAVVGDHRASLARGARRRSSVPT